MQIIELYKYARIGGGVTVSPIVPDVSYTQMYRLVADDGKMLKRGDIITPCVDTDELDWDEIDDTNMPAEEALAFITGGEI